MPNYRRWYIPGGTAFFTVVTYQRRPLFDDEQARHLLGNAIRSVRQELGFKTVASVLLPDHLHTIWSLPDCDQDYSTRWKRIKRDFTVGWLEIGGTEAKTTRSQATRGSRGVWQRRFYEHQVRDESELEALCDYIHYNPVKHGLVDQPCDWEHSTFHRFVETGHYSKDWGNSTKASFEGLDLE